MKDEEAKPILHQNLPILQVMEPFLLNTLLADAATAPFILARLSDTTAIVDPKQTDALLARLLKLKHTPKVQEG